MNCPKTTLISAYVDEELGDADKTAFEAHVQDCRACSAALAETQALRGAFAHLDRHQAPYGFATKVMARTAELDKKKSSWFVPLPVRFAEAAVLLLVITVGIVAGSSMMRDSSLTPAGNIAQSFSLDVFEANPPGSLGSAYLAMTEVRHEK